MDWIDFTSACEGRTAKSLPLILILATYYSSSLAVQRAIGERRRTRSMSDKQPFDGLMILHGH